MKQVISNQINENRKNTKGLFQISNKLTGNKDENPMPSGKTAEELAEDFATFFLEKINKRREKSRKVLAYRPTPTEVMNVTNFAPLTPSQIDKEIMELKNKSCELDIIPKTLLKEILPACLHTKIQIVNFSLINGDFKEEWKTTIVRPLLKKFGLEVMHKN